MMLVELTTVPSAVLPVAGFKDHLRLGSGFSDDGLQDELLEEYLRAALAAIEARTGKILIERDFGWTVTAWRDPAAQPLPLAPISAITGLVLVDRTGAETALPLDRVQLQPDSQRPMLMPIAGCLPAIGLGARLRIEMLAGFGPEWSDLPADLRQAVLLLAAHYHEYRHEQKGLQLPYGVASLIERYRTVRVMMGSGK